MVKHHNGAATSLQHAMNFANSAGCIGCVMKHAVGIHNVKSIVGEIELLSVGSAKCSRQIRKCKTSARQVNCRLGQINTRVFGPCFRELCAIGAETAANF